MAVTPATLRACWMLLPWLPMARPIRSGLTTNSSWKDDTSCLELYANKTSASGSIAAHCSNTFSFINAKLIIRSTLFKGQSEHYWNAYSRLAVYRRSRTNLEMLRSLVVAGHEQQLGPDVAEVHVAEQRHALHCCLTGGL